MRAGRSTEVVIFTVAAMFGLAIGFGTGVLVTLVLHMLGVPS